MNPLLSDQQFIDAWSAAVAGGHSIQQLAVAAGSNVRNARLRRDRLQERYSILLPELPNAPTPGRVDQAGLEHHADWTAEQCIESLRALQRAEPTRFLTRTHYAHATGVADATWNRHFGTFAEFKRQAGLDMPRHLHQLERHVAKHVASDGYRAIDEQRRAWAENYVRDGGGRWRLILGCNDVHDIDADPFWRRVFVDTARRAQPDVIVFNGDLFDLPEFSKYKQDPRTWNVAGRIRWVHDLLRELRAACPHAQIDIIEGNHEYRLVRHMADASPAMMSLLSDLHGMTVSDLFGLREFGVNYVAKGSLAAYSSADIRGELERNWRIYYDTVLANHFPEAARMGYPGWNGHHHSHNARQFFSPAFGPYEWHQVGAGHRRDASYTDGERWGNGFILWHVDAHNKRTSAEYVPVTDFASVGGRIYTREDGERFGVLEAAA